MEKSKLAYRIQGRKIDKNKILPQDHNILWRTNKSFDEIAIICEQIKNHIITLAKNLEISKESLHIQLPFSNDNSHIYNTENPNILHNTYTIHSLQDSDCLESNNSGRSFSYSTIPSIYGESLQQKSSKSIQEIEQANCSSDSFLSNMHHYNCSIIEDSIHSIPYMYSYQDKLATKQLMQRKFHFLTHKKLQQNLKKMRFISNRLKRFCAIQSQTKKIQRQDDCTTIIEKNPQKSVYIFMNTNVFVCQNKDWIEDYKQSIQPIVCGGFYIRPSWYGTNPNFSNLVIDPSLSFGSGHHATTAMCIHFLSDLELKNKNFLDVGCGSGILSLVAASLEANVYACDTDSYACQQSRINFQNNHLTYQHIWCGSIGNCEKETNIIKYDCICANIVSSIILILKNDFIKYLNAGGILILSGILQEYSEDIIESFSSLKLMEKQQIDEWISFKFIKK
ncbi:50S ribosomal protein L11 methyltransferase [Helicobacter didelphidarum]|uniref:50S ribosomal protein L11 methyltransferase n=1 Tax=Helicobacter didelphidarum TaxID=2040648 RepID=A0A3D8IQS1_9HELI|nr:50S ribosomal protein L11 methyltransferase [Helicobacter didelphidarum]RDU66961.1 50S ribosomal protein L11 methyltransferase [Helicobacter didelphidarum]